MILLLLLLSEFSLSSSLAASSGLGADGEEYVAEARGELDVWRFTLGARAKLISERKLTLPERDEVTQYSLYLKSYLTQKDSILTGWTHSERNGPWAAKSARYYAGYCRDTQRTESCLTRSFHSGVHDQSSWKVEAREYLWPRIFLSQSASFVDFDARNGFRIEVGYGMRWGR